MLAAMNDHTDTVKILLENGADVNTKNAYGKLYNFHKIDKFISLTP